LSKKPPLQNLGFKWWEHVTNSTVNYEASYFFCELAKELYMDEQQMQDNDIRLKDAYRKKEGLLMQKYFG